MRNPHNAASDVMNDLKMYDVVRETVESDPQNPGRWLITFESVQGADRRFRLHVEVMENEGNPFACVLERVGLGYRPMSRLMNRLMDRLEDPPRSSRPSRLSPSGGSPPSSPE